MTDIEHLLRACREQPEEDTPRLALADAIQEAGFGDAADYIRHHIELHHTPPGPRKRDHEKTKRLSLVTGKLAVAYAKWLETVVLAEVRPPRWDYDDHAAFAGADTLHRIFVTNGHNRRANLAIERGLPELLSLTAPFLMENAGRLFQFPIRGVKFKDRHAETDNITGEREYNWIYCSYPQKFNSWESDPRDVPGPLWNMLESTEERRARFQTAERRPHDHLSRGHYTSRAEANTDLRQAAMAFGRAALSSLTKTAT